jgi:DNA polymerase
MVTHRGPLDAEIVVVGQSPGAQEAEQGAPFVGPAGQLLSRLLYEAGYDEKKVLMTNSCFCAPPHNATPQKKQIDLCRANTWPIIGGMPRRLIICLGNEAWSCLHQCAAKGVLTGAGSFKEHEFGMTLWSVHPAAVMRNPDLEAVLKADLLKGKDYLEGRQKSYHQ